VIDLHTHILPAVDDGARTLEESVAIARAACDAGVHVMVATPHVRTDASSIDIRSLPARVEALNEALRIERIPLVVETGGELDASRLLTLAPDELKLVSLAGSRYLLVETPYEGDPIGPSFESLIRHAIGLGARPVLAHPERNRRLATVELVESLVADGALVQVTAASLYGEFGSRARLHAFKLISAGLAHVIASDAHRVGARLAALAEVGRAGASDFSPELVDRLSSLQEDIPAVIVADGDVHGPLPPLLGGSRARWWGRKLRRAHTVVRRPSP
jgi:protein-tyrosine phosphatase